MCVCVFIVVNIVVVPLDNDDDYEGNSVPNVVGGL